ncbi:MAG: XkdQ/YqbQ family protein [Candidatus Heimdallarchaeaceae archaeon]
MTIYTKLEIKGTEYTDAKQIEILKSIADFNTTSSFIIEFNNINGQYNDTFNLNEDVEVWADVDTNPATTQIFLGIIENIRFEGVGRKEKVVLTGRDYGAILQDILVSPRIFKDMEASEIVKALMIQNATNTGITINNVNSTGTTIEKITFNNICLFDAIKELAEISGYYFYIDTDKDLHFEEREKTSSGLTFDNTNIVSANFKQSDSDIFNKVTVYGDRMLTGAREIKTPADITNGSVYTLDDKPYNVKLTGSPNIPIQPGGILYVNDPDEENVQFLVNFQASQVVLAAGTKAGNSGLGWAGSTVIIDYQRSSPIVSIREDNTSKSNYGEKHKIIVDRNIKDRDEANIRANTFLAEHKDPKIMGKITINGIVDVTPGNTCIVNIPFHNINNQTYAILEAKYIFNKRNNFMNQVLKVTVNKRIRNFIDYFKEQELRLRKLEGSEVDTSITNLVTGIGSVSVETSYNIISRSIGSAFYLHIPGHNMVENSSSLVGDMRAGSTVISG